MFSHLTEPRLHGKGVCPVRTDMQNVLKPYSYQWMKVNAFVALNLYKSVKSPIVTIWNAQHSKLALQAFLKFTLPVHFK